MSYDVSFALKEKHSDKLVILPIDVSNITWNVRELIKQSSGWEIKNESENGFVKDLIPMLHSGLANLMRNPDKYKQYEATNGWGTIEGVKRFYNDIIKAYDSIGEYDYLYNFKEYLYIYVD